MPFNYSHCLELLVGFRPMTKGLYVFGSLVQIISASFLALSGYWWAFPPFFVPLGHSSINSQFFLSIFQLLIFAHIANFAPFWIKSPKRDFMGFRRLAGKLQLLYTMTAKKRDY